MCRWSHQTVAAGRRTGDEDAATAPRQATGSSLVLEPSVTRVAVRGRKGRQRLAPAQRREEILAAAYQVFVAHDPATVTFEEIAAEAGVSRALVYNYFGDKASLLAAVYQHAVADLDSAVLVALRADQPVILRLRAMVLHHVAFAQTNPGAWHILGHVAATRHPIVQAARRERVGRFAATLADTAALRVAMAGLLGLLEESLAHWLAQPEVSVEELLAVLEQQAWSGLGPMLSPRLNEFAS